MTDGICPWGESDIYLPPLSFKQQSIKPSLTNNGSLSTSCRTKLLYINEPSSSKIIQSIQKSTQDFKLKLNIDSNHTQSQKQQANKANKSPYIELRNTSMKFNIEDQQPLHSTQKLPRGRRLRKSGLQLMKLTTPIDETSPLVCAKANLGENKQKKWFVYDKQENLQVDRFRTLLRKFQ